MSTLSLNATPAKTLINQGFVTNPSGVRLTRRGRLARTLLVLSLAVVLASVFGLNAGANTSDQTSEQTGAPTSFVQVTVAPGDTLWSLATLLADGGDVRALVDEIASVNSLSSAEVQAGQKLRIPLR